MTEVFATPEAAACGDVPEQYVRVLGSATSPDGEHALVLLRTHEPPDLYPYLVYCSRVNGGWAECSSGNGNLWVPTSHSDGGPGCGHLGVWDEAPPDAGSVTVRFGGREHRLPVVEGYYLFAAWDVPQTATTAPAVIAAAL